MEGKGVAVAVPSDRDTGYAKSECQYGTGDVYHNLRDFSNSVLDTWNDFA